MVTIMLLRRLF